MFGVNARGLVGFVAVIALGIALTACKIRILVPEGGQVVSTSGSFSCPARGDCEIDVLDIHFDETFRAQARSGWQFSHWSPVFRGLCGASKEACKLRTSSFSANPALMSMLESDLTVYLVPVFERVIPESCAAS